MYVPQVFREDRKDRLEELMRRSPLATVVTLGEDGWNANHIPLIYETAPDAPGTLHGHVARANPLWRDTRPDAEVLAIFQGEQAYVSPSWYETKRQTGRAVPTWNYVAAHAYGTLETYTDAGRLRKHLTLLTAAHEAGFSQPWTLDDAPPDFIAGLLNGIVGIDIHVTRLVGKWKVSQNRTPEDRAGAIGGLSSRHEPANTAMAELMRQFRPPDES